MNTTTLSTHTLLLLLSAAYAIVFLGGLLLMRFLFQYPAEQQRAIELQNQEIISLAATIQRPQDSLLLQTLDFAGRYEIARMLRMEERHQVFELFSTDKLQHSMIQGVSLIKSDGSTVFNLVRHQSSQSLNTHAQPQWLQRHIRQWPDSQKTAMDIRPFGDNAVALLAIAPVYAGSEPGHPEGWLALYHRITDADIASAAAATRLQLQPILVPPNVVAIDHPVHESLPSRQRCIMDASGQPQLCLTIGHHTQPPEFIDNRLLSTLLLALTMPFMLLVVASKILLQPLIKATQWLENNNQQGVLKPILFDAPLQTREFLKLRNAYNDLVSQITRQQNPLKTLSTTDSLTNIPNRMAFDQALQTTWSRMLRRPLSAALVIVDIDYFKNYNDYYGHQAGDAALANVATTLLRCAKRTDEVVARYGGEEFGLIIYVDSALEIDNFRQRLKHAIRDLAIPHQASPVSPYLTVSAGIAWVIDSGVWMQPYSPQEWLRLADVSLYQAKASGRNTSLLQVISADFAPAPSYSGKSIME